MPNIRNATGEVFDSVSGQLVAMVDAFGNEQALSSASRRVQLTGPYTVQASDDGTLFWSTTNVTVTLPAGLSPAPVLLFAPPATGSITVTPSGGAQIAGSTNPYAINRTTNPSGVCAVSPYPDSANQYGVTTAGQSFSALTGLATDNTDLAARLAALFPMPPGGQKLSAAYTLQSSDNGAFIWLAAQAADKIISVPASILNGTPFWCVVGYLNNSAAAGRCNIKTSGGSVINSTINQSTGALATLTNGLFMGQASTNNVAACLVVSEGATPGGACMVFPLCGTFATA